MWGRSWSAILGGLWFILYALLAISNFQFEQAPLLMGVLAFFVGLALWAGK